MTGQSSSPVMHDACEGLEQDLHESGHTEFTDSVITSLTLRQSQASAVVHSHRTQVSRKKLIRDQIIITNQALIRNNDFRDDSSENHYLK